MLYISRDLISAGIYDVQHIFKCCRKESTYGANKTVNNAYLLGMDKHEVDCKELHGDVEILDG